MSPPAILPSEPLGKNGPKVPRIGVGLMNLSLFNAHQTEEDKLAVYYAAWNKGQVFWDTADEYADSEDLLGKWFAANPDKRKDIFLATKFGMRGHTRNDDGSIAIKVDSSPEYCKAALEKSLKRLGLPYVDLFYCHRLDKVTPIEHTVQAMAELKKEGKIKYLGLSECSADSLRRGHAVHPITAVEVEYGPACLDIESPKTKLLETCRELGVAVVCYSPLGNGLLGGGIRSFKDVSQPGDPRGHALPSMQAQNIDANIAVVDELAELSKRKGASVGQLCLAWILAQGKDIFPIPGTTKIARLGENIGAMHIEVSEEEEREIRSIVGKLHAPRFQETTGFAYGDTPAL